VREVWAQPEGPDTLGGACTSNDECSQPEGLVPFCSMTITCADNGFSSDRPKVCCSDGCCRTDAACCGELRCAPTYEPGPSCEFPPYPTRAAGQICTSNGDCFHWPGCEAACVNQRCRCQGRWARPLAEPPEISFIPEDDVALLVAETAANLEVSGNIYALYWSMLPDVQAIIPREAVIGWYENEFTHFGKPAARAIKVRFISWT
jgi:hypothetical protein